MQINLQAKNIELTEAITDYVEMRVGNLEKLLKRMEEAGGLAKVHFELGKMTNHHRKGDVFHAECSISINGQDFFAETDEADLYAAIDAVKESLFNEIERAKDRRQTMLHRGARSVKKMLKGLSKRNPFTSKY